jgi:hypothetical protein
MSRLYYDKPAIQPQKAPPGPGGGDQPRQGPASEYFEKVAKLVPSEVIAAYIAVMGLIPAMHDEHKRPFWVWTTFLVCLVITPIYLNLLASAGKPKWVHILLSMLAFVVWAFAISGKALIGDSFEPIAASIVLILFSLISGAIPLKQ